MDKTWEDSYNKSIGYDHSPMDNEAIIAEYIEKYVS